MMAHAQSKNANASSTACYRQHLTVAIDLPDLSQLPSIQQLVRALRYSKLHQVALSLSPYTTAAAAPIAVAAGLHQSSSIRGRPHSAAFITFQP
jgi:cell division inhibitor SulA